MADQFKNFMIGLFVTVAAVIIIFILMFLHPGVGNEGKIIRVRFTDIDKVSLGTRVTYGGRPVGEVAEIKEVEFARGGPTDDSGRVYLYELTLRVDTGVNVYNTDAIALHTSGLLGERNIEITPYAPKKGEELVLVDKDVIFAKETPSIEDAMQQLKKVASKVDKTLDSIYDILDNVKKDGIVDLIAQTLQNVESITHSLDKPKDLSAIVANIHTLTNKALRTIDTLDKTLHSTHGIMVGIENGRGTIGKLVANDDLYLRVNSIMSKLETTLDDINHYGLLFSSDKGWQRLRARRLNLLQKLRTPQEFRNYFNDEIDEITTSISRVHMVLENMGEDPYCGNLAQNPEYSKVFAELMRRTAMLEEEVRMYNTQVVETQVHQTELGPPPLCK